MEPRFILFAIVVNIAHKESRHCICTKKMVSVAKWSKFGNKLIALQGSNGCKDAYVKAPRLSWPHAARFGYSDNFQYFYNTLPWASHDRWNAQIFNPFTISGLSTGKQKHQNKCLSTCASKASSNHAQVKSTCRRTQKAQVKSDKWVPWSSSVCLCK